jgi:hypothetical protein
VHLYEHRSSLDFAGMTLRVRVRLRCSDQPKDGASCSCTDAFAHAGRAFLPKNEPRCRYFMRAAAPNPIQEILEKVTSGLHSSLICESLLRLLNCLVHLVKDRLSPRASVIQTTYSFVCSCYFLTTPRLHQMCRFLLIEKRLLKYK